MRGINFYLVSKINNWQNWLKVGKMSNYTSITVVLPWTATAPPLEILKPALAWIKSQRMLDKSPTSETRNNIKICNKKSHKSKVLSQTSLHDHLNCSSCEAESLAKLQQILTKQSADTSLLSLPWDHHNINLMVIHSVLYLSPCLLFSNQFSAVFVSYINMVYCQHFGSN